MSSIDSDSDGGAVDVGLLDAWQRWASGDLAPEDQLWGLSILWWGRIGRIAEFLGGLTVLVEVVGADRIRNFGASLRARSSTALASKNLQDPIGWFKALIDYVRTPIGSEGVKEASERYESYKTNTLFFIVLLAFMASGGYLASQLWGSAGAIVGGVLVGFIAAGFIGPFLTFAVAIVFLGAGIAFDRFVATPIAWALDRAAIDTWIKAGAALLLALGFHSDLLAP